VHVKAGLARGFERAGRIGALEKATPNAAPPNPVRQRAAPLMAQNASHPSPSFLRPGCGPPGDLICVPLRRSRNDSLV
jgi:hypothetical protein